MNDMTDKINLSDYEDIGEWEVEERPDGGYAIITGRDNFSLKEAQVIAKLPTLIPELKECHNKLAFLEWAEKTHPAYLNNLKHGYRRYKEASK